MKYCVEVSPEYLTIGKHFADSIDEILNGKGSWDLMQDSRTNLDNTAIKKAKDKRRFIYDCENPNIIYRLVSSNQIAELRNHRELPLDIFGNPSKLSFTFYTKNPIEIYIDASNWINGVSISGLTLQQYRRYVILHETGHALGYGHLPCQAVNRLKHGKDRFNISQSKKYDGICPLMYQMSLGVPAKYKASHSVAAIDYTSPRLRNSCKNR